MSVNFLWLIILSVLLWNCQSGDSDHLPRQGSKARQLYAYAGNVTNAGQYDSAIILLEQACSQGLNYPMQIVTDTNFFALIDHPGYRPEIRSLLQQYASDSSARMVRNTEPGRPILVRGRVIDGSSHIPISNVAVELVHADQNGKYFNEEGLWNPRLFAYLKTDKLGTFTISTIRPGVYLDDDGHEVAAHIHFTLNHPDYRSFASEFTFDDDTSQVHAHENETLTAQRQEQGGTYHYLVTLPMQKN